MFHETVTGFKEDTGILHGRFKWVFSSEILLKIPSIFARFTCKNEYHVPLSGSQRHDIYSHGILIPGPHESSFCHSDLQAQVELL